MSGMLRQINSMAKELTKLVFEVEDLRAEIKELKEQNCIMPVVYREGEKVTERLKNGG